MEEVKRQAHLVVQKCLRRKIQETMDLRSLAEKRITETDLVRALWIVRLCRERTGGQFRRRERFVSAFFDCSALQ